MEDFTSKVAMLEKNIRDKIDPADKGALDRVVIAGQKVMFDKATHKYMLDALDKPGEMEGRLAIGIIGLMVLLFQQSNGSMPGQIIIPAASILLAKAGEFVDKTEGGMTMAIYAEALKLVVVGIRKKFTEQQAGGQTQEGAQQPPVPQAAQQAVPQQPTGLLNARA